MHATGIHQSCRPLHCEVSYPQFGHNAQHDLLLPDKTHPHVTVDDLIDQLKKQGVSAWNCIPLEVETDAIITIANELLNILLHYGAWTPRVRFNFQDNRSRITPLIETKLNDPFDDFRGVLDVKNSLRQQGLGMKSIVEDIHPQIRSLCRTLYVLGVKLRMLNYSAYITGSFMEPNSWMHIALRDDDPNPGSHLKIAA